MPAPNVKSEPLILTPAEMAVVFQHLLGPTGTEGGLFGALDLQPPALDAARARLTERGLLRPSPDRAHPKTFIAPGARTLLGAVTRPLMLCVLQIMRPGQDERGAYFSWTPDLLVFNTVDRQGNHRLEPLSGLGAIADRSLAECDLDRFKPGPEPPPANPDAVSRAASLRAIFMTVASARTAHEKVQGLAWLISAGRLWLMAPQAVRVDGAASGVAPADAGLRALMPADLRAAILAAAQRAVDHTWAVLAAAAA
jgi:hypothetical protein